jgi:hypothetical protein
MLTVENIVSFYFFKERFILPLGVLNQFYCTRLILNFNTSVNSNVYIYFTVIIELI